MAWKISLLLCWHCFPQKHFPISVASPFNSFEMQSLTLVKNYNFEKSISIRLIFMKFIIEIVNTQNKIKSIQSFELLQKVRFKSKNCLKRNLKPLPFSAIPVSNKCQEIKIKWWPIRTKEIAHYYILKLTR